MLYISDFWGYSLWQYAIYLFMDVCDHSQIDLFMDVYDHSHICLFVDVCDLPYFHICLFMDVCDLPYLSCYRCLWPLPYLSFHGCLWPTIFVFLWIFVVTTTINWTLKSVHAFCMFSASHFFSVVFNLPMMDSINTFQCPVIIMTTVYVIGHVTDSFWTLQSCCDVSVGVNIL